MKISKNIKYNIFNAFGVGLVILSIVMIAWGASSLMKDRNSNKESFDLNHAFPDWAECVGQFNGSINCQIEHLPVHLWDREAMLAVLTSDQYEDQRIRAWYYDQYSRYYDYDLGMLVAQLDRAKECADDHKDNQNGKELDFCDCLQLYTPSWVWDDFCP